MKEIHKKQRSQARDYRVDRYLIEREKKLMDGCAIPVVRIPVQQLLPKLILRIGKSNPIGIA